MFPLAVEMYTDYNRANSSTIRRTLSVTVRCLFVCTDDGAS